MTREQAEIQAAERELCKPQDDIGALMGWADWMIEDEFADSRRDGRKRDEMEVIVEEKDNEGLVSMLGQTVTLFCLNYIYSGTLIGVNDSCVKLSAKDAVIVYETGPLQDAKFKDAQSCGRDRYVMLSSIESFERGK